MGLLLLAFVVGAAGHARSHNRDPEASDQGAYLDFAIKMRESGPIQMDGARGPLYPLALSTLWSPEQPRRRFFEAAKTLSIALAATSWLAVWPLVRRSSRLGTALAAWATIGMTAIVYYAPWVKAEAPFFVAQLAAFLLFARLLVRPTLGVAASAGFVLALAYLLKSSASIVLIAFLLALLLDSALALLTTRGAHSSRVNGLVRRASMAAVAVAIFVAACFPFLVESKRKFGQFTYNVNSNFYMWYDNWAQAKRGTRAHGDREGWPKMSESKLPSARKYFASHSAPQIARRVAFGLRRSFWDMERRKMVRYGGAFLLLALTLVATRFRAVRERARGRSSVLFFAGAFFFAHVLLSAWFYPLSSGARIMAAGYPIAIVTLAVVADTPGAAPWSVKGRTISAGAALAFVTALMLVVDVPLSLADDFRAGRGGR